MKKKLEGFQSISEILSAPQPDPVVRLDGKGNVELCRGTEDRKNWDYWFSIKDIETRRGLIRMIAHLCGKRWITTQHISELIDILGLENR